MKRSFHLLIFIFWATFLPATETEESSQVSKVSADVEKLKSEAATRREYRVQAMTAFAEGKKLEEDGKFQEALDHYERALKTNPHYLPLNLSKAEVLYKLRRVDETIKMLETLPKDSPEVNILLSAGYFEKGQAKKAREFAEKALKQTLNAPPESHIDYTRMGERLGRLFFSFENPSPIQIASQLLPIFEKAAERDPRNPQAQFQAGETALQTGNYEKAAHYYEKAYILARGFPLIRERLALALLSTQQESKAIRILEEILELNPDRKRLYSVLAELYGNIGSLDKAEDHYHLAIKLGDPVANDYLRLALIQLRNKKAEKASHLLIEAQNIFPAVPQIPLLRSLALRETGKIQEALDSLSVAEKIGAKTKGFINSNFYFEYGVTYEKANDIPKAEEYLQKSLQLKPDNHVVMNYLGYTWAERNKNIHEAEKLLLRALELAPDNAAYQDSLGWIYYRQGRYKEAEKYILMSLQKFEDDPEVNEHLGDVYEKLGNKKEALKYWKKALTQVENKDSRARLRQKISQVEKKHK